MGTISVNYTPDCVGCSELSRIDPSFNNKTDINEVVNALEKDQATYMVGEMDYFDNQSYPGTGPHYHKVNKYSAYIEIDTKVYGDTRTRIVTATTSEDDVYRKRYVYHNHQPNSSVYRIGTEVENVGTIGDVNNDGYIDYEDIDIICDYLYANGTLTSEQETLSNIRTDETTASVLASKHAYEIPMALARYANCCAGELTQSEIHTLYTKGITTDKVLRYMTEVRNGLDVSDTGSLTASAIKSLMSMFYPTVSEYSTTKEYSAGAQVYYIDENGYVAVYRNPNSTFTIPVGTYSINDGGKVYRFTTTVQLNGDTDYVVVETDPDTDDKVVAQYYMSNGTLTRTLANIVTGSAVYPTISSLAPKTTAGEFVASDWELVSDRVFTYAIAVSISNKLDNWKCDGRWIKLNNDTKFIDFYDYNADGTFTVVLVAGAPPYNEIRVFGKDGNGVNTCPIHVSSESLAESGASYNYSLIIKRAATSTAATLSEFLSFTLGPCLCLNGDLDISAADMVHVLVYDDGVNNYCIGAVYVAD